MHKEINFEKAIERALITDGGYQSGNLADYDQTLALFPGDILAFIQQTQPKFWQRLSELNKAKTEVILLDSLNKELRSKGMLTVLREGFRCFGKTVRMAYFAPNTGMDPAAKARYQQNTLRVVRQVQCASGAIPDLVITVTLK